jgi:hypothetical protein
MLSVTEDDDEVTTRNMQNPVYLDNDNDRNNYG